MKNFRIKKRKNSYIVQKRYLMLFWEDYYKDKWQGKELMSFSNEIEAKIFISYLLQTNIGLQ